MPTEPVYGAKLAADVAQKLDAAKVPNILWGWIAVSFAGDCHHLSDVEFVIPDRHKEVATQALAAQGYRPCTDTSCIELTGDRYRDTDVLTTAILARNRFHFIPMSHFHVGPIVLSLLAHSEILFWLPEPILGLPPPAHEYLMLSTDLRLPARFYDARFRKLVGPCGPWTGLYPIRILNPNCFTESIIYLMLLHRDDEVLPPSRVLQWMIISLYDKKRPNVPQYRRSLRPEFRLTWDYLNLRCPESHHSAVPFLRLREHMIENGRLPPSLPKLDSSTYPGWDEVKTHMG